MSIKLRLTIAKFLFTIIIFVCWSTLSIANVDHFAIENYVNKSLQLLCNDDISLNFSNAVISEIKRNFISSSVITCLNLTSNSIEKIGRGAFDRLPNLTQLFLSNNKWSSLHELLDFGGHAKLQVLIMNNAKSCNIDSYHRSSVQIIGEYPNLEILSLSGNCIKDFALDYHIIGTHFIHMTMSSIDSWVPFPKLKILDLSRNRIMRQDFNLKTLDLSGNLLKDVPQISNETEISILYISNNYIYKILSHTFTHMPKLIKLLMGENRINEIDVNAFASLTVLEELDLSRNMLSFLPKKLAETLVSLKYLDLSENKFTSLESLSLTNTWPSIKVLYLMKNPLKCLNVKYFENLPQNLTIDLINNSNFTTYVNDILMYSTYMYKKLMDHTSDHILYA
ncbi:PREDICTED: leucine-rich repeat-containing G-protein coupled receptor 5-like [Atta cephalotes]|uniref:Uncharacterized protein n=1 Tax=Atta cephalotes TaxID=12957 RepID=A0A158NBB3_ATTCE|nr:PREDICTED: leucine-rich repeat-containing G-protein coupled receptor 5-like [Atta cephalotes]